MKRRDIIKSLSIAPLVSGGLISTSSAATTSRKITDPLLSGSTIYDALGVDTVINCRGTFTIIGGSAELPQVVEAMGNATGYFVQLDELAFAIGEKLAKLTGAEWGMVSAGCASAMRHVTAACITGGNPEKLIRIPDLTGFEKTEVITPRYARNVYDHAVRNNGVTMIDVDTPEELKQAISPRTAMIYMMSTKESLPGQPLSLENIAKIVKPHNIPILMDAAAENLTIPNVHLQQGATIVAYSGGKAIRGPQCAGLLLGDKNVLMSAWQASSPHHGPGRDSKIGKEEMMGMVAAVEGWIARDHEAEWDTWLSWLDLISKKVTQIEGITTSIEQPEGLNNRSPRLIVKWDPDKLNITGAELAEDFARKKPRIAIGSQDKEGQSSVNITPSQMQPGNAEVVADRINGALSQERKRKSSKMKAPTANIAGRWKVDIDFFSSKGSHTLFLEQDGNWIQGSHQGDFSVRELVGMIEGDQIKLRSDDRYTADNITFIFHGKFSGGVISGSIFMGEYLTAEFKAKRNPYEVTKKKVVVPGGPPLAT